MAFNNKTFENDFKEAIKSEFAAFDHSIDMENRTFTDIFILYANWRKRFVGPRYRKVYCSKEIQKKLKAPKNKKFKKVIEKIAYKFKNGEDITPYLSKGIVDCPILMPDSKRSDIVKEKDRDKLLNAFNIHHLHIGNNYENVSKNGINFVNRNNEIIAVLIKKEAVYIIDIFDHKLFPYSESIFSIIQNNWESILEPYKVQYLIDIAPNSSEDDTKDLINNNINSAVKIGNKSYMFSEITTSGHNNQLRFEVTNLINKINQIETLIYENKNMLLNALNQNMKIKIKDGLLYFVEDAARLTICYHNGKLDIINDYCKIGSHTFDFNS